MEKNVEYKYELPATLEVPDKYQVCYRIVDELLKEALG